MPARIPHLIPFKRAASVCGIPYVSLRDAAHRGLLRIVRFSRAWFVDEADLAEFIERHRETLR